MGIFIIKYNIKMNNNLLSNLKNYEITPLRYFLFNKPQFSSSFSCPFLDQINRRLLDFDNRKICSKTLTILNVYTCLICGIYFEGRSKFSPVYNHSLIKKHKLFIHLLDSRIFCLPENYEIFDPTLHDIKHNLHPTFLIKDVINLDFKIT